jgi:3',5'-cyclic-nucleotide phosphodiesterase
MKMKISLLALILFAVQLQSIAQTMITEGGFKVIPLGVEGGLDEANLSAYLVAAAGSKNYICMDAGTIHVGIKKSIKNNLFEEKQVEEIQHKYIKGYFISHGHLDHVAGLIMNAPSDNAKPIYALPSVIDVLKNNYFSWKSWANFANEGDKPALNKYTYTYLTSGKEIVAAGTNLKVTAYSLSHVNPYESTAFLINNNNNYLLYLGDTGADSIEKSNKLKALWTAVAEKVKLHQLKAIFMEVSYDNSMPAQSLFGHLTPKLLLQELKVLNQMTDGELVKLPIYITHIKPCEICAENIKQQVKEENKLGLNILFAEQAKMIEIN